MVFKLGKQLASLLLYLTCERLQKRSIRSKLPYLHEHYALSLEERKTRNIQNLYAVLTHAKENVPYYKDLFASVNFLPEEVLDDVRHLEKVPYLTKEIVREKRTQLCCKKYDQLILRQTGGSTGPRTNFWYDQEGLDWTAATNMLAYEWAGHKLGQPEVHLSTRFRNKTRLKAKLLEGGKCLALNRTNIYTDCLEPHCLDELRHSLRKAKPNLTQGPPSTFYALAVYLESCGLSGEDLFKVIESTGEKLESHKRRKIEDIFRCSLVDRYGAAEFGVMAHEVERADGRMVMKLMDHLVWPETIPLGGGLNEMVFTGLMNPVMPLIRYRMGDLGSFAEDGDDLIVTRLEGRVHDSLMMGGKSYPSHYFLDTFSRLGNVVDFQLMVNDRDELSKVLIVSQTRKEHQDYMRKTLHDWFQLHVPIEFCEMSELQRCGWRNKFRYIVREQEVQHAIPIKSSNGNGRPRVAVINHSLAINGANNHVRELLRLLDTSCKFTVYAVSEGPMRHVYEKLGVKVHVMDGGGAPDFTGYDLVLGNTLMTAHVVSEASSQGVPTAITVHESWHPERLAQHIDAFEFGDFISEEIVRNAVEKAEILTFPAAFQADLYRPLLPEGKDVRHIYCTIPFPEIDAYFNSTSREEARAAIGINNPDEIVFLQVGTVTRRKNQLGTIGAFAEFRKLYPDTPARLMMLGARHSRQGEHEYALDLQKEIEKEGLVDCAFVVETTPDPYPYFRAADVVVHPSYNEVLPLSIIEAGAFRLPSIVSSLDGLPEVVVDGETGYLVDPNDRSGIVGNMHQLSSDADLRSRMGKSAYDHVRNQHDSQGFIRQFGQLLSRQ
jgi:phenylacetate-CoA ligase